MKKKLAEIAANLKNTWEGLDQNVTVNKRELVIGVAACTLAGLVFGMLFSPKKTVNMGSYNGSNNVETLPKEEAED